MSLWAGLKFVIVSKTLGVGAKKGFSGIPWKSRSKKNVEKEQCELTNNKEETK